MEKRVASKNFSSFPEINMGSVTSDLPNFTAFISAVVMP